MRVATQLNPVADASLADKRPVGYVLTSNALLERSTSTAAASMTTDGWRRRNASGRRTHSGTVIGWAEEQVDTGRERQDRQKRQRTRDGLGQGRVRMVAQRLSIRPSAVSCRVVSCRVVSCRVRVCALGCFCLRSCTPQARLGRMTLCTACVRQTRQLAAAHTISRHFSRSVNHSRPFTTRTFAPSVQTFLTPPNRHRFECLLPSSALV